MTENKDMPVAYRYAHPRHGNDYGAIPPTEADKAAGWSEIPLYGRAAPPAQDAMREEKASGIARPKTLDQACARVTKATIAESVEAIGNAFNQKFGIPQPESVDDEATTYKIAEYAGKSSDLVMIWANDRNLRKGGYCLECVPRDIAPSIISALTSAQSSTVKDDLTIALAEAIEALKPFAAAVHDWEGGWIGIYEEHVSRAAQVVAKHGDGRS